MRVMLMGVGATRVRCTDRVVHVCIESPCSLWRGNLLRMGGARYTDGSACRSALCVLNKWSFNVMEGHGMNGVHDFVSPELRDSVAP